MHPECLNLWLQRRITHAQSLSSLCCIPAHAIWSSLGSCLLLCGAQPCAEVHGCLAAEPACGSTRVRGMACARTGHGMCRNRCCVLCIGRWHSSRRPGGSRAAVATMEAARSSELLSRGQGAPQPAASLAPLGDSFRTARHVAACCLAFRPEASQQLLSWQLWRSALQAEISAAWCAHAQCSPVSRALLSVITRLTLSGPSPTPTP